MSEGAEAKCCERARGWLLGNATSFGACRWALVPLRLMLGVIFSAHGAQKAFGWFGGQGFGAAVEMVRGLGFPLPVVFAAMLVLAEFGGGVLLILGVAPRLAAFGIAISMAVALVKVHWSTGFFGTHLQQVVLAACVTVMLAGGGAACLSGHRGQKE